MKMQAITKLAYFAADDLVSPERIKADLTKLKEFGFDGIVLYTGDRTDGIEYLSDSYMKAVSDIILIAKSLEAEIWICGEHGSTSYSADDADKFIAYDDFKSGLAKDAFAYISGFFCSDAGVLSGLGDWCRENGKELMAGVSGMRNMQAQTSVCGSDLLDLRAADIPMMISAGRYPSDCLSPRIASSIAGQFGSGRSACIVFEGAGWGLSPSDVYEKLKKLIECGINTFIFHACRESLNINRIIDRPPSLLSLPWKAVLPEVFARLEHLAEIEFARPRKILVLTPAQAECEDYVSDNAANDCAVHEVSKAEEICTRLHEIGRRFDITDELMFESEAEFGNRGVTLGKRTYSTVLVTPGCSLSKKGMMYIERAKANGVRILSDIPTSDTEVIPLELIKGETEEIVREKIIQSDWSVNYPRKNRLVLMPEYEDGSAVCEFKAEEGFVSPPLKLLVSDEAAAVSINNIIVTPERRGTDGVYYDITDNVLGGRNKILLEGCSAAYVCLFGEFRVIADRGYLIFDERQVQTTYEFTLTGSKAESSRSLTECGYPFCTDSVTAKKIFVSKQNILHPYLMMDCRHFSAAEITFDGEKMGWIYNGSNTLPLPLIETGKQHLLEVRAFSSAYNAYGPNFYYKGDSGLITESQYLGVRNFADGADAPEITSSRRMKLVMWSLPENIEIIQKF